MSPEHRPAIRPQREPGGRRLRADKHEAIVSAARAVFARMGYVRASTEAISREATVSTRTLYNHFPSKDELFRRVLLESSAEVVDAFLADAREIDVTASTEAVVGAIAQALAAHRLDFPEHFAMARQINTERDHFPDGLLEEWQAAGPEPVEREVSRLLASLAERGLLVCDDAGEAADQLILLVAGAIAFRSRSRATLPAQQAEAVVARGVRTFLHGYVA